MIEIAGRKIGCDYPPFLIGEVSANHNGSIDRAKEIIQHAALAGFDAVKLQAYTPESLTIDSNKLDFQIKAGLWRGRTLFDLYKEASMPLDWHNELFKFCQSLGITVFSSVFDRSVVDLLENLDCPAYKIASFECIDLELIRYAAGTKKPIIISTGMANFEEISEAFEAALDGGASEIALLHCVSGYPAQPSEYNLSTINDLSQKFNVPIGLSDHTVGSVSSVCAIALGASLIEKHITICSDDGGPDDEFSLEVKDFALFQSAVMNAHESVGNVSYTQTPSEIENQVFRRSLYFVVDVKAGTKIDRSMVRSIRPGFGLKPKHIDKILGRVVLKDCFRGDAVTWQALGVENFGDLR
jgi:pseudaminic acid synthase